MHSHPPPTPPLPNEAKTSSPTLRISLKFLKWQALYETEKPFQIFINIPPDATDQRTTNLVYENVDLIAKDVRYINFQTSLDKNGFIYCKHQTHIENFNNREYVDKHYLPEVEALLRSKVDDVDRIFFFDWRLRKNVPEVEGEVVDLNDRTTWLRPAMHVHIDQSPAAALKRVQLQFKEDADFLLGGRVRIINVWRPLVNSVEDWPLAVCDGSTVNQNDLVEADHIRRHYMGSTMYLQHHKSQQFYFMSKQSKDDVLIFKNFDSRKDVAANFAPHASFRHPRCPEMFRPRESIEARALVFTYPKKSPWRCEEN